MINDLQRGIVATLHITSKDTISLSDVEKTITILRSYFSQVILAVSEVTKPEIKRYLWQLPPQIYLFELPAVGAGPARRQAVARAGKTFPQLASFQLCDFDRLITWCEEYPDELSALSCQPFPTNTFCILGRTKKAFLSHPTAWQRTEKLVNEIAAEVFHIKGLDITAGSVLFSAELIPLLVSADSSRWTDGEWPTKVKHHGGHIFYQACEGLCYKERNTDHLQAQPAYQLMRRLQIAAAIADSLYLEREF